MKPKITTLATKTQKPKKPTSKAAYFLAVKIMAEMDVTERF